MSENRAKTKICIIRSNPVNPDSRVEKEACALKKAGFDVHILAWDRDTDELECDGVVCVADESIPITRLGHKASYGEGFKNIFAYLAFQKHQRSWLKKQDFDIIHSCDFDTAFFSRGIAARKRCRFVFDIFDFLYDRPANFMQRCVKRAQIRLINSADATIICSEERIFQISGSRPKNLTVIHNTPPPMQAEGMQLPDSGRLRLVYVGVLQEHRLLCEIMEAVSRRGDMELHIGGFGKLENCARQMAREHDNIFFYGRTAYKDTLALEQSCDIMLAVYDPCVPNHRYAAPNKFYEGLMLGKPLIMVKNTGMAEHVGQLDIGAVVDYTPEAVLQAALELKNRRGEWGNISDRAQKLYRERFSWSEMEKRLVKLYLELSDEKDTDSK